jgi:hypothetical protein
MFQVRFHGRGGQGVVTAAELLALAAFREDRHAQAFPSFGCERMGAPVMSFRRIDDKPIRTHEPIAALTGADGLIGLDAVFAAITDRFAGKVAAGNVAAARAAFDFVTEQLEAVTQHLYAETNQEAADLHIQAFRIAEELSNPVMVCMDGFLLTRASERMDLPDQAEVDAFLPPYEPRQVLDPDDPVSIGAMVGPEAFTEVRYLANERMRQALELIPAVEADFGARFGRGSGGLIVVALGSVLGTVKDAIDELRDNGVRVGAVGITTYRPFPAQAVRDDIRTALATGDSGPRHAIVRTVIAGLGGRPVTRDSLRRMLTSAERGELPAFSFLDLDMGLVAGELTRIRATRRSGPSAENILRDLVGRA